MQPEKGKAGHLKKRSFALSGHRTSVALEDEFWAVLEQEARDSRISLAGLVGKVDSARGERNLASALRLHALMVVSGKNPPPV